jgi:hypothetical protein
MSNKVKLPWLDKTLRGIKDQARQQVTQQARSEDLQSVE